MDNLGYKTGALVRGVIESYNGDGTVQVKTKENQATDKQYSANLPLAYNDGGGGFLGAIPPPKTEVLLQQTTGEWHVVSILPSRSFNVSSVDGLNQGENVNINTYRGLDDGVLVMQAAPSNLGYLNRISVSSEDGISVGSFTQNVKFDPENTISTSYFENNLNFPTGNREISGVVKRNKNLKNNTVNFTSTLSDDYYNKGIDPVGMDAESPISKISNSTSVRNLSLVENRRIYYEFQHLDSVNNYSTDEGEAQRYKSREFPDEPSAEQRSENLTDTFGLSLNHPNHLIEQTFGTAVDIYGNVLDLNRSVLPIGTGNNKFKQNPDSVDAFNRIRALHRRSIAYHFEVNSRKDNLDIPTGVEGTMQVPDYNDTSNMGRNRSRFSFDVDKEGQFKLNVPSSSETGSVPVLTRYENVNEVLVGRGEESSEDPNIISSPEDKVDVKMYNFAVSPSINLSSDEKPNGEAGPLNFLNSEPIKLGTAFHDITQAGLVHQQSWFDERSMGVDPNTGENQGPAWGWTEEETFINEINPESGLLYVQPIEKAVTEEIKVSGENADGGGRSGTINFDGFVNMSVGANTVDRQSMWLDTAGGIVSTIGKDRRNNSVISSFDGNVLLQIGNQGIPSNSDERFKGENPTYTQASLDIRLYNPENGVTSVVRVSPEGIYITTAGEIEFAAKQNITLRSAGEILLQGESVVMYPDDGQAKIVKKDGGDIV